MRLMTPFLLERMPLSGSTSVVDWARPGLVVHPQGFTPQLVLAHLDEEPPERSL